MVLFRALALLLAVFVANLSYAAEAVQVSASAKYGLSVSTSGNRWAHSVNEDADSFQVKLRDSQNQANGYVYAVLSEIYAGGEYSSPRELAEKRLIPRYIKSHGTSHTVEKSSERKMVLGNGIEATVISQHVIIRGNRNNHDRSMTFLFWQSKVQDKEIWYFGALANAENYFDLEGSELILQLLSGIR